MRREEEEEDGKWNVGRRKRRKKIESKERLAVEMSLIDTENEDKPCK